jgi:glycosyltransferase involved in cell wall biosynthesis
VDEAEAHLAAGRELAARVLRRGFGAARAVYAFNSAAEDVFAAARRAGVQTVYEQTIAPVQVEWDLLREEYARWPDWEAWPSVDEFYARFRDVERREWDLADRIVCGSEFVRDSMAAAGGPADRCAVVPYGVDLAGPAPENGTGTRDDIPRGRKLRVLTVGAVNLRKGAPYVAAAAARLAGRAEFRWAGAVKLSAAGATRLAAHVQLTGAVPRPAVADHLRWADVFLLPSVCEGSATASYEALLAGRPVVVTPNTGAPVRDGEDGLVVPIRDVPALAAALEQLADDPDRLGRMKAAAGTRAADLTVRGYGQRLLSAVRDLAGEAGHET